jgi:putative ABC transport system substrate-binding protein
VSRVAVWIATVIGLALVSVPAAAEAPKTARIGYLAINALDAPEQQAAVDAFRLGLRERGWVEGRNLVIEFRAADGKMERLADLADELVRLKVDLIVAPSTPTARAAQRATTTIPIVAYGMGDPVGDGLVASLARPGGNITGATFLGPGLVPKRLELLKEALPKVTRVAALWQVGAFSARTLDEMRREAETAARALGVRLQLVQVRRPEDFDRAFAAMTRERAEALAVLPGVMFFLERRRLAELAEAHRLPTMFVSREFVEIGGLMSYGPSLADLARRASIQIDKLLRGARPGELPVEQPTLLELVVNARTARALGITIPAQLLLRADRVID